MVSAIFILRQSPWQSACIRCFPPFILPSRFCRFLGAPAKTAKTVENGAGARPSVGEPLWLWLRPGQGGHGESMAAGPDVTEGRTVDVLRRQLEAALAERD